MFVSKYSDISLYEYISLKFSSREFLNSISFLNWKEYFIKYFSILLKDVFSFVISKFWIVFSREFSSKFKSFFSIKYPIASLIIFISFDFIFFKNNSWFSINDLYFSLCSLVKTDSFLLLVPTIIFKLFILDFENFSSVNP